MTERESIGEKAQAFFEDLWKRDDPWDFESSGFERQRYARLRAVLDGRHYGRTLEIGCGAGAFTQLLAGVSDELLALDISSTAIARAKLMAADPTKVEFRVANIMDYDLCDEGPWDLVVMTETIYYLGWLYPFFDVGWLASQLFAATREEGRLLLANTQGGCDDALLLPWLIRTYRDLFQNVGFRVEAEEVFRGSKDGVPLEVLISLFSKPGDTLGGGP